MRRAPCRSCAASIVKGPGGRNRRGGGCRARRCGPHPGSAPTAQRAPANVGEGPLCGRRWVLDGLSPPPPAGGTPSPHPRRGEEPLQPFVNDHQGYYRCMSDYPSPRRRTSWRRTTLSRGFQPLGHSRQWDNHHLLLCLLTIRPFLPYPLYASVPPVPSPICHSLFVIRHLVLCVSASPHPCAIPVPRAYQRLVEGRLAVVVS